MSKPEIQKTLYKKKDGKKNTKLWGLFFLNVKWNAVNKNVAESSIQSLPVLSIPHTPANKFY